MENACKYLQNISERPYDLNNDIEGDLTQFISTMPEEEEDMTIKQWIQYSAENCHKLVRQMCDDMINDYKQEQARALKVLESLPTVD